MPKGFLVSLPERIVRTVAAALGGAVHESAQLILPRLVRRSRLYEATAKNLLRVVIELVGGVQAAPTTEATPPGELAVRKGAGNVVELGSIAAFGFSPLWLLAGASDAAHGSRVYLDVLAAELKAAGVLAEDAAIGSIDDLLHVLEQEAGTSARLIDIPPLELAELRASLDELWTNAAALPTQEELAAAFAALRRTAEAERRSLLEVSVGVGLAFLTSARKVGGAHVVVPFREDWRPLSDEGFGDYARRVTAPYARAVASHLDPAQATHTEKLLARVRPRRR